jgi:hypothetical protein
MMHQPYHLILSVLIKWDLISFIILWS